MFSAVEDIILLCVNEKKNHLVASSLHSFWTVHGREPERGETSDSISRLLYSNSLAFDFSEPQLQAESRNLTGNHSMLDTSTSLGDDRPRKMQRIFQDLPVLREGVLKDFSQEAMESFKSVYNPTGVDEEVSSGWQFFLQESL
jgi:hypothetical protein